MAGSPIGLTMYLGVIRMLNLFDDPTDSVTAAIEGDSSNIDFDVGDIYGGGYDGLGLPKQMLASSFAKLKDYGDDELSMKVKHDNNFKKDICRSLMTMVTINSLLFAKSIAQIEKI